MAFWLGPQAAARGYRLNGFDSVGSTNIEAANAARLGDAGRAPLGLILQS